MYTLQVHNMKAIPFLVLSLTLHHCYGHPGNRFHTDEIVGDVEHIKSHYQEGLVDVSSMTQEQLEFHFFRSHDTDNNFMLDGLEILSAIQHHGSSNSDYTINPEDPIKGVASAVDQILHDDDFNKDGYLTYTEFTSARRRELAMDGEKRERERRKKRGEERVEF